MEKNIVTIYYLLASQKGRSSVDQKGKCPTKKKCHNIFSYKVYEFLN